MKMHETVKKISVLPRGIRYKLLIAFSLMSVIPLLVVGYVITNFIFLNETKEITYVSTLILICIIIAWLGLLLAKSIIDRVIDISVESRIIASGNFNTRIVIDASDEIGQIGETMNLLTRRIRDNILELKDYQEKTREINMEIQKKVLVLSNLMQVGDLISASANIDSIINLVLSKLSQLYEGGFAALYTFDEEQKNLKHRSSFNITHNELLNLEIVAGQGLFGGVIPSRKHLIVDASSGSLESVSFKSRFGLDNAVIFPIFLMRDVRAVLLVGNSIKNFTYTNEDLDIINVFAKQLSIAIESNMLIRKAESLAITDDVTSLFNKKYIRERLSEEIRRAQITHRPCSLILMNIDDFRKYESENGPAEAEMALKKVAKVFIEFSSPAGKAGRIDRDSFALILPEASKKEAMQTAEKIRQHIERSDLSGDKKRKLTTSGGVSENPLDGSTAEEIFNKAELAFLEAKQKGKNKVLASGV
ncbi:MAG: diguanylate cyclase [Candidatus Omnitrophica bacterium]|nr:diguanylate cyclase [Candidatus Omnitrophota bacterium]